VHEVQTTTDAQGNQHTFGKMLSLPDMREELLRDYVYYENGGGVTWSGGEPLLQFNKIEQLLDDLRNLKISQYIETSLYAPAKALKTAIKYIDGWYVDLKILYDASVCRAIIGGDLKLFTSNLEYLFTHAGRHRITFRFPFIPGFTDSGQNQTALIHLVKEYSPAGIEILKAHNLGRSKYEKMGAQAPRIGIVDDETLGKLISKLDICNTPVRVLEI